MVTKIIRILLTVALIVFAYHETRAWTTAILALMAIANELNVHMIGKLLRRRV